METSARNDEIVDGTIAALSNPADRLGVYNRMRLTQLPALQPGLEGDTARVPPEAGINISVSRREVAATG